MLLLTTELSARQSGGKVLELSSSAANGAPHPDVQRLQSQKLTISF